MVTTNVLSLEELQNMTAHYEKVLLMAYLPNSEQSERALQVFEQFSRQAIDTRFVQFDSTSESGLRIVKELGIKYAPMTFAFRGGAQVKTYVGVRRSGIEGVVQSIAVVDRPEELDWNLEWPSQPEPEPHPNP